MDPGNMDKKARREVSEATVEDSDVVKENRDMVNDLNRNQSPKMMKYLALIERLKFPITLEPIIFLYTVSVGLNEVIRSNLIIDKICLSKLNYTEAVCGNLQNETYEDELKIVQDNVADYEGLYGSLAFAPRILYALLAGTWSDRHGRKFIIGLPVLGQLLASLSYLLNYLFLHTLPWQMLFLEFIYELCGSYVAYYLAVYSYITDVSRESERTFRISILDGMDYFSTAIGTRISGPLFLAAGYYGVFGCSAASSLMSLSYLIVFLKESLPSKAKSTGADRPLDGTQGGRNPSTEDSGGHDPTIEIGGHDHLKEPDPSTATIGDKDHGNFVSNALATVVESLRTVLKRRESPRRAILWLGILNFACYIFVYNGTEGTHRYLYAIFKYGWKEQEFTRYLFNYRIAYIVALWIVIPIISRLLRMPDPVVGMMACLCSMAGFLVPAFTEEAVWFTVGSFICMFSPLTTITTRSVLSRVVSASEIGRVFSVLALCSAASGSLVEAAFQKIYASSNDVFAGGYLLVLSGLLAVTLPTNLYVLWLLRRVQPASSS